jgi:hypothetical protein
MRALAFSWLGALAACGAAPPATTRPTTDETTPEAPRTPAPRVDWAGDHFEVHGLPAVARANEILVVDAPAAAAARELRLEVRDRDDKALETIVVTPTTTDAANQRLVTLHGVHALEAMHAIAVEPGHDGEDNHWATGDNLDIEWRDHRLSVFVHNGRDALVVDDGTPWLVADRGACRSPAYLHQVFHAVKHDVAVIAIGYRGGDGCEAMVDQRHVVTWYPR